MSLLIDPPVSSDWRRMSLLSTTRLATGSSVQVLVLLLSVEHLFVLIAPINLADPASAGSSDNQHLHDVGRFARRGPLARSHGRVVRKARSGARTSNLHPMVIPRRVSGPASFEVGFDYDGGLSKAPGRRQ